MRYNSFSNYLKGKYGARVHRLSLNAGFTCPNKDGRLAGEGCIYCNEKGFSLFSDNPPALDDQITRSMEFARSRYKADKFIAYFQNASSTYADPDELKKTYDVILKYPDIVGLFISTRPDCIDDNKLDLIRSYTNNYEVWIEYGLQTIHDSTLKAICRGHDFECSKNAIERTHEKGIKVGVHVILGLPGEKEEDMVKTARILASLPVSGVKFHVLHVLKDTPLEEMYRSGKIELLDMEEYVNIICKFLENTPKDVVIFRLVSDADKNVLVAPEWINSKQEVISSIEHMMDQRDAYQGKLLDS